MITLFAPSFPSLIFALHEFELGSFEVVTRGEIVYDFCLKAGIPVQFIEYDSDNSVKGMIKFRNYSREMSKKFEGREILFCFHTYDAWGLYQLMLLRKKSKIYFYDIDYVSKPGFNEEDTIHIPVARNPLKHWGNGDYNGRLIKVIIIFFLTGIWFDIFTYDSVNYAPGLTLKRCQRYFLHYKKRVGESFFKSNQKLLLKNFSINKVDILFIDSAETVVKYPDNLITFLKDFEKEKGLLLFLKPHPSFPPTFNTSGLKIMDKNIPAEIISGFPKVVIGVASTVLLNYSANTPVISLFYLLDIEEGSYKDRLEKFITTLNADKPKSIDELNLLLKKYLAV